MILFILSKNSGSVTEDISGFIIFAPVSVANTMAVIAIR